MDQGKLSFVGYEAGGVVPISFTIVCVLLIILLYDKEVKLVLSLTIRNTCAQVIYQASFCSSPISVYIIMPNGNASTSRWCYHGGSALNGTPSCSTATSDAL